MDEEDWLGGTNPESIVPVLRDKASDRKLRLLTVAVCRRVMHLMPHEHSPRAVQVAERLAEGHAGEPERIEAEVSARSAAEDAFDRWEAALGAEVRPAGVIYWAAAAAVGAVRDVAYEGAKEAVSAAGLSLAWSEDESLVAGPDYWAGIELSGPWSQVIRDIFGNPFRPPLPLAPRCSSGTTAP